MFEVTNLSTNPLQLSDGKRIAPGATRQIKNPNDREVDYESRGWLRILDLKEGKKEEVVEGKK